MSRTEISKESNFKTSILESLLCAGATVSKEDYEWSSQDLRTKLNGTKNVSE